MDNTLNILILEDNDDDAELLILQLEQSGLIFDWQRADNKHDYQAKLNADLDLIISDYSMPQFDAPSALMILKDQGLNIPFIVVTGTVSEEQVVECIKLGAVDYLMKDRLRRLGESARQALNDKQMRTEKRRTEEMLKRRTQSMFMLHEIAGKFSHTLDLQAIFTNLYDALQAVMECDLLYIYTYTPVDNLIRRVYARHQNTTLDNATFQPIPLALEGDGSLSSVILGGRPIYLADYQNYLQTAKSHYDLSETAELENLEILLIKGESDIPRSALLLPQTLDGQVVGVIQLLSYNIAAYTDDDLLVLESLLPQFTIAMRNANLYQQAQMEILQRKQAEAELSALYNATSQLFHADSLAHLGQQIVQAVVREFRQVDCGILVVDKKQKQIIRLARTGDYPVKVETPLFLDGQGLIPEAIQTGNMIYAPDVQAHPHYLASQPQTQSELVVPLLTTKGIVGALDLQSVELDGFSERDQRILSAFAERAAVAIEIMQLYEEINHHVAELEQRVIQRTAELQHTTGRVTAILNSTSDGFVLLKPDGRIQQTNPAFEQMLGILADDVFNWHLSRLVHSQDSDKVLAALKRIQAAPKTERLEATMGPSTGVLFDSEMVLSPVVRDGQTTAIVCSVRDISERKEMEAELRRSLEKEKELNDLKTRFVSMVTHDFRTPLTTILTSTDILNTYSHKLNEERKQGHHRRIQLAIKQMTQLLDDVLMIARADAGRIEFLPQPLDLEGLCRDIVESVQVTANETHEIIFTAEGDCQQVMIDGKLLHQILTNLLSNAVKYSPQGGKIYCSLVYIESEVILQIKDHGIGIPASDQERLFESFHRAMNVGMISGTGLGLAIVKQAVDIYGGTIQFDSQEGQGTTFTVTLPAIQNNNIYA